MQVNKVTGAVLGSQQLSKVFKNGLMATFKVSGTQPNNKLDYIECLLHKRNDDKLLGGFGMRMAKGLTEEDYTQFFNRVSLNIRESLEDIKNEFKTIVLKK